MHSYVATLAVLFSISASSVLGGKVVAPGVPAARVFEMRQTSRDQVVRRMSHGMRRVNKRQSQPSGSPSSRCGAPATFLLQISAPDSGFDNYYANFEPYGEDDGSDSWTVYADPSANSAAEFSMTNSCALGQNGLAYIADIPSSGPPSGIWFDTPGNIQNSGYVTPTCKVTNEVLTCDFDGSRNFALCPNGQDPYFLATYLDNGLPANCIPVTLNVIPVV